MDKKVVGKMDSALLALMVMSLIAPVTKDIKITIRNKITKQIVLESLDPKNDIEKLLNYLTGDENYKYAVEFEATLLWPYSINESVLKAFNIPNCCEVSLY